MISRRFLLIFLLLVVCLLSIGAKKGHGRRGRNQGRSAIEYFPPVSGQRIRFGGGNRTFMSGNIEVYLRNKWGIICDDSWGIIDANVACKQLGFTRGAVELTETSYFGHGSWNSSDILMDDVDCLGQERNILTCNYEYPSNCITEEGAGAFCKENTGCPTGWIAGDESCYFLSNITTTKNKFAINKCANQGGHLVNIETEAENHFLSNLFAHIPGEPIIIGGIKKRNHWMWEKVERSSFRKKRSPRRGARPKVSSRTSRQSTGSSESITQTSIQYFKWFPGWIPGNENMEPSGKKSEKCLFLKSSFPHPDKGQGEVDVGYLFWSDDVCLRKKKRMKNGFRFLCERRREEIDSQTTFPTRSAIQECYRDNGVDYRGTHANTEKGTNCINWADSSKHTPEKFPDKGLEGHNYCRNPDDDVRPWCYVDNEGSFGYCPVLQCDNVQVEEEPLTTTTPVITTSMSPECPDDKFYCAQSAECITQLWHCDYENDCNFNEDEQDCDYKVNQFEMTLNREIRSHYIKETYIGLSNETCAKLCLSRTSYVCRSFAFYREDRSCDLSDVNTRMETLPYTWKNNSCIKYFMEFRFSRLVAYVTYCNIVTDCDGMFTCNNGRCIDLALVCNHHDDCDDLSDEQVDIEACRTTESIEVRLVGGTEEQEGRVEVKHLGQWGVICDDDWDDRDAAVICNMLGYKGRTFIHYALYILACTSSQYSCSNGLCLEASSVCDGICHCNPHCEDENGDGEYNCRTTQLHVVNGNVTGSGRVEIIRNGLKGTVCDDDWDNNDATVVCKTFGYRYGKAVTEGAYGEGTGAIWLDDVQCTGLEESVLNCEKSNWGVTDCSHAEDAGVICTNTPPSSPDYSGQSLEIVLEDGNTENEGRVEVIYNGKRGTVCDDKWDDNDATVVCKMLGYRYGVARIEAHYGPGSDRLTVMLDDVECIGTESSLLACTHAGWGISDCGHGEDAGVKCYGLEDDGDQIDTGDSDELSGFKCGLRPLESKSRKKREEPDGRGEAVLGDPVKFARIIGGFTATHGFYPWQVGVRRLISDGQHSHWCGGTILSEHWILSAAHCFTELSKGHVLVRTGDHDNKVEDEFEQEFALEQMISHVLYDDNNYNYDIALLKIKRKDGSGIKFTDHVQPACLPEQTTEYISGQKCHVSGWGQTENGYQNLLKSAKVPIISDQTCKLLYKDLINCDKKCLCRIDEHHVEPLVLQEI
ncbi:uncharacterized protein LOC132728801 [Ruditapes philippinarum]|uniref:uncharacterized protein LOC132728801 n=1 Tax=Ruditapes philippinarum TaxID=129788 RepID=UPI00295BA97E|nr:uncharacterized protein LOC132728801 [Ruditapes philippinarum]